MKPRRLNIRLTLFVNSLHPLTSHTTSSKGRVKNKISGRLEMDKRSRSFDLLMCFFIVVIVATLFSTHQQQKRKLCELENEKLRQVIAEQEKAIQTKPDVLVVPQEQKPEKPKPVRRRKTKQTSQTEPYAGGESLGKGYN
jgi:hypothetical protein